MTYQALAEVDDALEDGRRLYEIRRLLPLAVDPIEQDRQCFAET